MMEVDCVFYCCARCHGLFVTSTDLKNHNRSACDGSVAGAVGATMFAVSAKEMLLIQNLNHQQQNGGGPNVQLEQHTADLINSPVQTECIQESFVPQSEPVENTTNGNTSSFKDPTYDKDQICEVSSDTSNQTPGPITNEMKAEETPNMPEVNKLGSPSQATVEGSVRKSRRIAERGRSSLIMVGDKIIFSGGRKRKARGDKGSSPEKKRMPEMENEKSTAKAADTVASASPQPLLPSEGANNNYVNDTQKFSPKQEIGSLDDVNDTVEDMTASLEPKQDLSDIKVEKDNDEEFIPIRKREKKSNSSSAKDWKVIHEQLAQKYQAYVQANTETVNNAKSKTVYQCPFCPWKSTMVGFFDRHITTKHGETGSFMCTYCDSVFTERPAYNRHMKIHEKSFICETCAERFTCAKDLQRHMWKHTGEKPYKCDQCEFSTRFKERLKIHRRLHTGERLHCDIAGCKFSTRHETALKQHKDGTHGLGKKLQCSLCPYTTFSAGCMSSHTRQHQGIKNFQCSVCGYRAITKQMVIKHLRTKHSTEKPYKCDRCDYRTAHTSSFRMHIMTHLGLKPFQCTNCGYHSVAKQKVIRHITTRQSCRGAQVLALETKLKLDWSKYRVQEIASVSETPEDSMVFDLQNTDIIMTNDVMEGSEVVTMVMPEDCDTEEVQQQYLQQDYTSIPATDIQTITFADTTSNTQGMYSVMDKVIIIDTPNTTDVQEVLIETQPS